MTDRELLLERLERLAIVLDELMPQCAVLVRDAIELLKEQDKTIELQHSAMRGSADMIEYLFQRLDANGQSTTNDNKT